ncbi:MAG: TIGR03986 family CRISPR-associated RAMP protein [Acidobacteria bacterium]|nr:TIGR03986 family CRISPR-associated RAMP protein [Acidobacteriota bacterium]
MSLVHAPYGFVPLSNSVFLPTWQGAVSQDLPFEDSLSGTIEVKIVAETPIFVRGSEKDQFFRTPDGAFAIPGSSVRGVVRNVLEIATFGWMSRVNDHRYGVRDLHNQDLYVRHMAGIMAGPDGRGLPMPKVIAGWLQRVDGQRDDQVATITPCHFAKIEYRMVMSLAKERGVPGFSPGSRQSAVSKYTTWGKADRKVSVKVENLRPVGAAGLPYDFGRVVGLGPTAGTLVFTGQPSPWRPDQPPRRGGGQAKHHDFVFYGEDQTRQIPVSGKVFNGFDFVHSDRGQQNARNRGLLRNEEWAYWGDVYDNKGKVPVFFLVDEKTHELRAFGLAMMFRLAYDNSVMNGVRNSQPTSTGGQDRGHLLDFAQTLFGNVADGTDDASSSNTNKRSLKGRVSFGLARAEADPKTVSPVELVLGGPKASYYPAYVEQQPLLPGSNAALVNGKPKWMTWMDTGVRVRGWKRYRPQLGPIKPPLPTRGDGRAMDLSRVASRFNPLPQETSFLLPLRLHNVRPVELGAILWALNFGGDPEARHTLGMGRSLGYGRCRFEIVKIELENMNETAVTTGDDARAKFEELMEGFAKESNIAGGWAHSRQIFELRALAHTLDANSPHRSHMRIDDPNVRNEFQNAKLAGNALPPAGSAERWRAEASAAGHEVSLAAPAIPVGVSQSGSSAPRSQQGAARKGAAPTPTSSGIKGGTRVEIELTGSTKTGKWRAKILNPAGVGTVSSGNPPPDAAVGKRYTVTVTAGGDLKNVQMKWD